MFEDDRNLAMKTLTSMLFTVSASSTLEVVGHDGKIEVRIDHYDFAYRFRWSAEGRGKFKGATVASGSTLAPTFQQGIDRCCNQADDALAGLDHDMRHVEGWVSLA